MPTRHTLSAPSPFVSYLRTVGRGERLSRALRPDEAEAALGMILDGTAAPEQVGAFLLVLRYRRESADELAGFVRAVRARLAGGAFAGLDALAVDLDWPSYADRHRQLPYFVLAALLLAHAGVRVCMHGLAGAGPVTTPAVLAALGIEASDDTAAAARALDIRSFAYVPVTRLSPPLARLFDLRRVLGVRTAANSLARELNPARAPAQLQGVFHPTYVPLHVDAARILGQPRAAVFKGGGGEIQRNPDKPCRVAWIDGDAAGDETWPALTPGSRHRWRDEPLSPAAVRALWTGEVEAAAPVAAVVGTAALALKLLGRAPTMTAADAMAQDLWHNRPRPLP